MAMSAAQAPGRIGSGGDLDSPDVLGGSERVYAGLLLLYPGEFRRRYADEMVRLFGDQLRDARASRRPGGTAAMWFRTVVDLVSSAVGEHIRRDRTLAQSLATFQPTWFMRVLGLFGVVGALLLLVAFVTFEPFANNNVNIARLVWFALAGTAISLALYPRQAIAMPRLAFVSTAAVGIVGATYAVLTVQAAVVAYLHLSSLGVDAALWISAALYGAAVLGIGAAWRGMPRWASVATRLGAISLLGSAIAWVGDDRFHLVDNEVYGQLFQFLAATGAVMNGIGWLLLGTVLLIGGRRRMPA
jgi:hypothetical protein